MPAQVDFYLLAAATVRDKYIYACKIATTAYNRGMRVYMQTDDAGSSETLDKMLWTFSQSSFVPHAIYREQDLDADKYPVQIGTSDAPKQFKDLLISLTSAAPKDFDKFARVSEIVLQNPQDKIAGRARWRFYLDKNIEPKKHEIPA